MRLIVGLGNPGREYEGHRHNVGFQALDRIAAAHGLAWKARFQGQAAEGRIGQARALLLKPGTFMNLSGQAVGEALRWTKLGPEALVVIHDELDLAPGVVKWKAGGGHAGHNGLRSIHQHLGTDAYGRVRVGIGHPGHKDRVSGWVLHDPSAAEAEAIDAALDAVADVAEALACGRPEALAARTAPPARNTGPRAPS